MEIEIVPSGWAALSPEQTPTVLSTAAALIPDEPPPGWPAGLIAADERRARLGGRPMGSILGPSWKVVALRSQQPLQEAAASVQGHRIGSHRLFDDEQELLDWARTEGRHDTRCLLLVGTGISWDAQELLQQRGFYVGRLPFDEPSRIQQYTQRLVAQEHQQQRLPRRAWVIAPNNDPFTRMLHRLLAQPIQEILRDQGFPEESIVWADGARRPAGALPGLVLLLTHGVADAGSGAPVVSDEVLQVIYEACGQGAVVAHLGCNGAGSMRDGRYRELANWLPADVRPQTVARDVFSEFTRTCLLRGAQTVLAHVDVTWSHTLYPWQPFEEWLRGVSSGSCAAGFSARDFYAEASRAREQARDERRQQQLQEAGRSWLRHLDLHGFVTLGDPCCTFRWE